MKTLVSTIANKPNKLQIALVITVSLTVALIFGCKSQHSMYPDPIICTADSRLINGECVKLPINLCYQSLYAIELQINNTFNSRNICSTNNDCAIYSGEITKSCIIGDFALPTELEKDVSEYLDEDLEIRQKCDDLAYECRGMEYDVYKAEESICQFGKCVTESGALCGTSL